MSSNVTLTAATCPLVVQQIFQIFFDFFVSQFYQLCIFWGGKHHNEIFPSKIWAEIIFSWPTFKFLSNTPTLSSKMPVNNIDINFIKLQKQELAGKIFN